MIWLRFLAWWASHLRLREIWIEGALYMSRYAIAGWLPCDGNEASAKLRPFNVYLHRIHLPDAERYLHNHPWKWGLSIVLAGSYTERKAIERDPTCCDDCQNGIRRRRVRFINFLTQNTCHAIDELHGEVWTLFISGPRVDTWGFLEPGRGIVPWRQRLIERGITPEY
jgi:hypothetical protein